MKLVSVSYEQSRLNFFRDQLAAANRRLDWSMKHNPDWYDHAEKGEVVSFYEWAVKMAEEKTMKTPDVIKKGLERCKDDRCICDECEFSDGNVKKWRSLMGDALAYIEQLEERIDLMLIQMAGDCGVCKHRDDESGPCDTCMHDENRHGWEYEGLPEVKNGRWVRT